MSQGIPRLAATSQQANISPNQARTGTGVQTDYYKPDNTTFNQAMSSMIESNDKNAQMRQNAFAQIPDAVSKRAALDAQIEMEQQRLCAERAKDAAAADAKEAETAAKLSANAYALDKEQKIKSGEYFKMSKEARQAYDLSPEAINASLYLDKDNQTRLAKAEEEGGKAYVSNALTSSGISEVFNNAVKEGLSPTSAYQSLMNGKVPYREIGSSEIKYKNIFDDTKQQEEYLSSISNITSNPVMFKTGFDTLNSGLEAQLGLNKKIVEDKFLPLKETMNLSKDKASLVQTELSNLEKNFQIGNMSVNEYNKQKKDILAIEQAKSNIVGTNIDNQGKIKELNQSNAPANPFFNPATKTKQASLNNEGKTVFTNNIPKLVNQSDINYVKMGNTLNYSLSNPVDKLKKDFPGVEISENTATQFNVVNQEYTRQLANGKSPMDAYRDTAKTFGYTDINQIKGSLSPSNLKDGKNITPVALNSLKDAIVSNYGYVNHVQANLVAAQNPNNFNSMVLGGTIAPQPVVQPTQPVAPKTKPQNKGGILGFDALDKSLNLGFTSILQK